MVSPFIIHYGIIEQYILKMNAFNDEMYKLFLVENFQGFITPSMETRAKGDTGDQMALLWIFKVILFKNILILSG